MKIASLLKDVGFVFVAKLIITFCFIYFFQEAFIGITAPGGWYVPFIDENLNYINWLRTSILQMSFYLCQLFGLKVKIVHPYLLLAPISNVGVKMVYTCIGYGLMSLWTAFIITYQNKWQQKLKWLIGGLLIIWFINSCRVTLLLFALDRKWYNYNLLDHHTIFNIIAYVILGIMIYYYTEAANKGMQQNKD